MSFDALDHSEYRTLIRAWIAARQSRSQAGLARRLDVSRSKVAMVLSGAREISLLEAPRWADALGLDDLAARYFGLLVRADAPISLQLRRRARVQARSLRAHHTALRPSREQGHWLSRWFSMVLLELARRPGFQADPEVLAEHLWPPADPDDVREALHHLESLGVLNRLRQDPTQTVATEKQLGEELSRYGLEYHHTQLEHASRALDEQAPDQRFVYSRVANVRRTDLEALQEALSSFQLEVLEQFRADVDGDQVIQVQMQMFARER